MKQPRWLDRPTVDAIHLDQLEQHGGRPGVRDDNALESALARPCHRRTYEPASDLPTLAAAYGFGLVRNHPYTDGNKRVAFMAMYVFLEINGVELETSESDVVATMLALAAGGLDEAGLVAWLRERTEPRRAARG